MLYVSNLDDGMIYRVDSTSLLPVGTPFDHGVQGRGAASLSPPIPDTGAPGLSSVGRRVWGVKTYKDRLFYAVWWEHSRSIHATESNEIWSVDLDNNGNFIPSTATLRATVPDYPQPGTTLPVRDLGRGVLLGSPVMNLTLRGEAGDEYEAFSGTDLLHLGPGGKRILPLQAVRMVSGPGGTFLGLDGAMDLSLPVTPGQSREFFKVRSVDPVVGKP